MGALQALTWLGLRKVFPTERALGLEVLDHEWSYHQTSPDAVERAQRFFARYRLVSAPASKEILPVQGRRSRWIVYFIYLPEGRKLDAGHRFTLTALRKADAGLMVVCASPSVSSVPRELLHMADSLFWKNLPGFDFSAYAVALNALVWASPGSDVFVLNDSVFGPVVPLDGLWGDMQWDLTSFTASGQVENHIQSYAFHLKELTSERHAALQEIFPTHAAFDDYQAVVLRQETRFARIAARSMSVGALWYCDPSITIDPSLFAAIPLVEAGFPFLKRGLLSKHQRIYPSDRILDVLRRHGHPVEGFN
jgi:lipopolysaccharide biosynthesis protein